MKAKQNLFVIENVRGKEDTAEFQFYKHTSKYTTFDSDEEIRRVYYLESIELVKKLTVCSESCMYALPLGGVMECCDPSARWTGMAGLCRADNFSSKSRYHDVSKARND